MGFFLISKKKWENTIKEYVKKRNEITKKHVLLNVLADVLRNLSYLIIILVLAKDIFNNPELGIGIFILVLTLSSQLQNTVANLFVGIAQFLEDAIYMKSFFEFEYLEKDIDNLSNDKYDKADITIENLSFTYPNSTKEVIRDINLKIPAGQKVAIVGENGSGKTTLISLICGMHIAKSGAIKINNENIKQNLMKTRNSISAVFSRFW